ncbi:MAG: alpha/beta hydrolase [Acidimicrobiales bacterium]
MTDDDEMIVADGVETRVRVTGEGNPLVLIHGSGNHLEVWGRVVPLLANRFRCVTYDMVDHGWSADSDHDATMGDYVGQLRGLLDALSLEAPVLVGHSLGAGVALHTAVADPGATAGVVAVSGSGRRPPKEKAVRLADLSEAAARNPDVDSVRARLGGIVVDPATVEDLIGVRMELLERPGALARTKRVVARLRVDPPPGAAEALWERLAASGVPLGVVWGADDPVTPVSDAQDLAGAVPDSRCVVIDDCGHLPQYERPAEFVEALLATLSPTKKG